MQRWKVSHQRRHRVEEVDPEQALRAQLFRNVGLEGVDDRQAQNQAVRMTSMRCCVSRRYTFMEESSTASAQASTIPVKSASTSSGR